MVEQLIVTKTKKSQKYIQLLAGVTELLKDSTDLISAMANLAAALKYSFNFFWVGFYLVNGDKLTLGPFQGPIACMEIPFGKGVCGSAWQNKKTIIVEDVNKFPGHIACNSASKSEIVLCVFDGQKVIGVLDIDSDKLASFDAVDEKYLTNFIQLLNNKQIPHY
ncbi:MAG: GAF domain-containing protein [Elusimicrobiota bacterium]|jgi:GAF domain-containing protein|nr:GAF domain-containing protein [Elusimicrobiota bacterium]